MTLGAFIKQFSHNNLIRLLYKIKGGHEIVLDSWNDVSMDWQVISQQGKFRHYINNEVIGLASICFNAGEGTHHPEAINIVIERLNNQPYLEDKYEDRYNHSESIG